MKEAGYLEQQIIRLWTLYKIPMPVGPHPYKAKLNLVAGKLAKFAQEKHLPFALILNDYAYFFGYIAKEKSFNKIYIRLGEFMDNYAPPKADINEEDVEFAGIVERDWNGMYEAPTKGFPFTLKTMLAKSGIRIKDNTFFKHDHKFQDFCIIANFVRHNRKFYPQIHGMKEFFVHLPIIWRKPGEYIVWQYTAPDKTLDQYYRKVYGDTPKEARFEKFAALLANNETLTGFENVWGIRELPNDKLPG